MLGDEWQKFANLRLYLSYMRTQPGKKLLFMGQEFGQRFEWNHDAQLPWWELEQAPHAGVAALVADLNRLYRGEHPLSDTDFVHKGFRWFIVDDRKQTVFAWQRRCEGAATTVLVANFTPEPWAECRLGVPQGGEWREILNSDAKLYGGSGLDNWGAVQAETVPTHGHGLSVVLNVPPLALLVLRGTA
jgi:1,4-alpha-glucan branching enzyme